MSKHWPSNSSSGPPFQGSPPFQQPSQHQFQHHSQHQNQQPFRSNNNIIEPLKIVTNNEILSENLSGYGSHGGNFSGRHHDSGYISPNLPPNKTSFFDGNNGPQLHQPRVDPLILQQVLQQQQQQHHHPKQQPQHLINPRPITGKT